jgi:uncharacterized protein (UPF0276 family)
MGAHAFGLMEGRKAYQQLSARDIEYIYIAPADEWNDGMDAFKATVRRRHHALSGEVYAIVEERVTFCEPSETNAGTAEQIFHERSIESSWGYHGRAYAEETLADTMHHLAAREAYKEFTKNEPF